jgi:hypothetical protein
MKLPSELGQKHFYNGVFTVETIFGLFRESFND